MDEEYQVSQEPIAWSPPEASSHDGDGHGGEAHAPHAPHGLGAVGTGITAIEAIHTLAEGVVHGGSTLGHVHAGVQGTLGALAPAAGFVGIAGGGMEMAMGIDALQKNELSTQAGYEGAIELGSGGMSVASGVASIAGALGSVGGATAAPVLAAGGLGFKAGGALAEQLDKRANGFDWAASMGTSTEGFVENLFGSKDGDGSFGDKAGGVAGGAAAALGGILSPLNAGWNWLMSDSSPQVNTPAPAPAAGAGF